MLVEILVFLSRLNGHDSLLRLPTWQPDPQVINLAYREWTPVGFALGTFLFYFKLSNNVKHVIAIAFLGGGVTKRRARRMSYTTVVSILNLIPGLYNIFLCWLIKNGFMPRK